MLTVYQELLIIYAEELRAISVRPFIPLAEHQQVKQGDLKQWLSDLKQSEEYNHLFRHDLPAGVHWTHVAIPSAGIPQDYDDPTIITIEGISRIGGMMGQQIFNPKIQVAYFFQTDTEARDWLGEHSHKLDKMIRRFEPKIYPVRSPVEPD